MLTLVSEAVERYAVAHTSPPGELYERLRDETYATMRLPQMQVGPLEGAFLRLLAQLMGARRAVEVGTFTGYSGLCIAQGLAPDGVLHTCDVDPVALGVARRYFGEAPWGARVRVHEGPALASIASIEGPLDLVFIDADKPSYTAYWEALVPKVRPGGLLVADNVLWSGRVVELDAVDAPARGGFDEDTRALWAFNEHVARDERVERVTLTVRDGLLLARRR